MTVRELNIKGLYEITLSPVMDFRGYFMRTYDRDFFKELDLDRIWIQENHSRSEKAGTIRGLHLQLPPFDETKLVRCIRGAVFDVAVDLRKESLTFGSWISTELSEGNKKMLYIPRGCAHGFCTLTDGAEVTYKVDNSYSVTHEIGILWNDKDLNIHWPLTDNPVISGKDSGNMSLRDFMVRFKMK